MSSEGPPGGHGIDQGASVRGDIDRALSEIRSLTERIESMSSGRMAKASRRYAMMVDPIGYGNGTFTSARPDPYNVKDFGAVGDGATDDTVAIQAAVTAAETDKKNVVIPSGTYLISAPIEINPGGSSKQEFVIEGNWAILKATGTSFFSSILNVSSADPFLLRGLHLDCNDLADSGLAAYKINNGCSVVEKMKISNARIHGMHLRSCQMAAFRDIESEDSGVKRTCDVSGTTLTLKVPVEGATTPVMAVGDLIVGAGISAGTTIASITDEETVVMSASGTTASDITIQFNGFGIKRTCTINSGGGSGTGVVITDVTDGKNTDPLSPGDYISGSGIPAGTTIASITDEDTIVMSASGTGASGVEVSFSHKAEGWMVRGCNASTFDGCSSSWSSGNGFTIMGTYDSGSYSGGCSLYNTHTEDNFGHGVELKNAGRTIDDGVYINGGWFEDNKGDAFNISLPSCIITNVRITGGGTALTTAFRINKIRDEDNPGTFIENYGIVITGCRVSAKGVRDYGNPHVVGGSPITGCTTISGSNEVALPPGKSESQGGSAAQIVNYERWNDIFVAGENVEQYGASTYYDNYDFVGAYPKTIIKPSSEIPGDNIGSGSYWQAPFLIKKRVDWGYESERTCTVINADATLTITGTSTRTCATLTTTFLEITGAGTTGNLLVGDGISGTNIAGGATIAQILGDKTLIMSAVGTGAATGVTVTFTEKVAGLTVGDPVEGTHIASEATIASINSGANSVEMSAAATGGGAGTTVTLDFLLPWRLYFEMGLSGAGSRFEAYANSTNATVVLLDTRRHYIAGNYHLYNDAGLLSPVIIDE